MSEPVRVRDESRPVFCEHTLPVHRSNPGTDVHQDWPEMEPGVRAMPMQGRYVVVTAAGPVDCEDGFLLVDDAGKPYWRKAVGGVTR